MFLAVFSLPTPSGNGMLHRINFNSTYNVNDKGYAGLSHDMKVKG